MIQISPWSADARAGFLLVQDAATVSGSHARRLDHHNTRTKSCQSSEVRDVECQHMCYRMHMADGNKAGVMDLLADHSQRTHQGLPCRVDVRRLRQQWEPRLECRC